MDIKTIPLWLDDLISNVSITVFDQIRKEAQKCNYQIPKEPGFVYAMWAEGSTYFKFGLSKNPEQRLKQVYPKMPFRTCLVRLWSVPHMKFAEDFMHRAFSHKRVNGEWFELEPIDIWALFQDMGGNQKTFSSWLSNDLEYAYAHHFMVDVIGLDVDWIRSFQVETQSVDIECLQFEIGRLFKKHKSVSLVRQPAIPSALQALIEEGDPDPEFTQRSERLRTLKQGSEA